MEQGGIGQWGKEIDGIVVVVLVGSVRTVGVVGMAVGGDRTVEEIGMVVVEGGRVVGWVGEIVGLFLRGEGVMRRQCRVVGRFFGSGIFEVGMVVEEIVGVTHVGWEVEMVVDCSEVGNGTSLLKDVVAQGRFDPVC